MGGLSSPDRVVWSSTLVRIAAFRCPVSDPCFPDSGPARNWCFVFPRSAVKIQHEHEPAFTANPNVVTFYNRDQAYQRQAISEDGDRCDWFGVDANLARDVVREFDPDVDRRPEWPFRMSRAWSDTSTYLLQRGIFRAVCREASNDAAAIEESVIHLLERVVRSAYGGASPAKPRIPQARQREIAHFVETILSRGWREPVRLHDLAAQAGLSVYHLCRTFRRVTGVSIQQYRNRLRVRSALEAVWDTATPLVEIALGAGFYSHSHFTGAFRREFDRPPVTFR